MRVVDRDLIRGGHYGQRSRVPRKKAEHMAAPTNAADVKKSLANPSSGPWNRAAHTWPASTGHRGQASSADGSGDARQHRPPCRPGKVAYWQTGLRPGCATTSGAGQLRHADPGRPRGTSSCRYRCRRQKSRHSFAGTWRAPCLGAPRQLQSLAGREHGRTIPLTDIAGLTLD
jgi:hypothetical protein